MTDPVVVSGADLAIVMRYLEKQYSSPAVRKAYRRIRLTKVAERVDFGETGLGVGMVANPNGRYLKLDV